MATARPVQPTDTRERILFATLDVFARAGYRGATTRVIAREAGVREITLFRLFGSKAGLFAELVQRIDELLDTRVQLPELPHDPYAELVAWSNDFAFRLERLDAVVRVALAEHESQPQLTAAVAAQGARALRELTEYFERLKGAGAIASDADPPLAARLLAGAVFAWATAHSLVAETSDENRAEVVRGFCQLVLRGVGSRGGTLAHS